MACRPEAAVQDLARFLDALLKGRPFRRRATLRQMLDVAPAQGEGGLAGYGLGVERCVTMTFVLNTQDDPTPLVIPAVQALAATRR